jgi:hypothetical protein
MLAATVHRRHLCCRGRSFSGEYFVGEFRYGWIPQKARRQQSHAETVFNFMYQFKGEQRVNAVVSDWLSGIDEWAINV